MQQAIRQEWGRGFSQKSSLVLFDLRAYGLGHELALVGQVNGSPLVFETMNKAVRF